MYKAGIEEVEHNYIDYFELVIDGDDAFEYGDKRIAKFVNIPLEEYRNYLRSNFICIDVFEDILFEYKEHAEGAKKWLQEKLEPINVMEILKR
jgi:hypothetical protein